MRDRPDNDLSLTEPPASYRTAVVVPRIGIAVVVCLVLAGFAPAEQPPASALQPIFNGRDFTGWRLPDEPYWRIEGDTIVGESDDRMLGSMLFTERSYGDVIVEGELRFTGEIDSGIMLRSPEVQVQIGVSRSLRRDMTCSFYVGGYPEEARAEGVDSLLEPGGWNRIRVEARGDTFTVWLNGHQVSRYTSDRHPDPAPLGLQIHKNVRMKVEFRDLRALPLD